MKKMQKVFSVILSVCITACLLPVIPVLAAEEDFSILSFCVEEESISAQVRAKEDCTLIAALYGDDGVMLRTGTTVLTGSDQPQEASVPLTGQCGKYELAKVMLLDSETLAPLCDCTVSSATEQEIAALDIPETWKQELREAEVLGFPMDKLTQETVSGAEMTQLLDFFVADTAPEALEKWKTKYPALRNSQEPLTRFDAMAALFLAADTVGGEYAQVKFDPYGFANTLDHSWDEDYLRWELYGGWQEDMVFDIGTGGMPGYLDGSSYYYNLGRRSSVSGEFPFGYDAQSNSLRVKDQATYLEAALAVMRLKTSDKSEFYLKTLLADSDFYYLDETDMLKPYYEAAAERKEAIFNTATEITKSDIFIPGETYTGTAYYISPDGNDANDGLSPETAWRTPVPANWGMGNIQEGDAVFFERGGIYRLTEMALTLTSNVTYSAYGQGDKPVITLSKENSARAECWELWYEGERGEKIWRYYQQLSEVGGIVFDDSSYAKRVLEWPTPDGWLALDIQNMDPVNGICAAEDSCALWELSSAGEYRSVEEQLLEDLSYLIRVDIADLTYPIDFGRDYREGDLYLRCDSGNPGEQFEDIEIIALPQNANGDTYGLLDGYHAGGFVLDNLSLKYYLDNAVSNDPMLAGGVVIQNCTVEWGGTRLHRIESEVPTNVFCLIGDCIYNVVTNATIRNNYMRHGGNGCTFESSMIMPDNMGTYTASGNLIENCGQGIRTYFIMEDDVGRLDTLVIRDNIILNTGDSMNNACLEEPVAIDLGCTEVQFANCIEVSGNVMIGSTMALMRIPDTSKIEMNIHNNVFGQSRDGILLTECAWIESGMTWHMMEDVK